MATETPDHLLQFNVINKDPAFILVTMATGTIKRLTSLLMTDLLNYSDLVGRKKCS